MYQFRIRESCLGKRFIPNFNSGQDFHYTRHGAIERETILSDYVEPLGKRILIRKDESRQTTRGGIVLPDSSEIPTITGRVVEISVQIERDDDFPIRKYDKVLFHPKHAIPVDFEADNLLYVVPIEDVVAIFRRDPAGNSRPRHAEDSSANEDLPSNED